MLLRSTSKKYRRDTDFSFQYLSIFYLDIIFVDRSKYQLIKGGFIEWLKIRIKIKKN